MMRSDQAIGSSHVSLTATFFTPNRINDGSKLYFTFPFEQVGFNNPGFIMAAIQANNQGFIDIQCNFENQTSDNVTISVYEWCQGDCQPGTNMTIVFLDTINPQSISANYPISSFQLKVVNPNGYFIEQQLQGVQASPYLKGLLFNSSMVTRQNNLIGSLDYLVFSIPLNSLLDSKTQIIVTIPEYLAYQVVSTTTNSSQCQQFVQNLWTNRSCIYSYYNDSQSMQYGLQSIQNISITNICTQQSQCQGSQILNLRFQVRNPFTQQQQKNNNNYPFQIYAMSGYYQTGYGTIASNLTMLNPNYIDAQITKMLALNGQDSCNMTGQVCNAQFSVSTSNPVPRSINYGQLIVNVPPQMSILSSQCAAYLFGSNINVTCQIVGNQQIQVRHNVQNISNSTFQYQFLININQLKNPFSTQISDSFQIATYQQIGNQIYSIDLQNQGPQIIASFMNYFNQANITRNNIQLGQNTQLTFAFQTNNYLPSNVSLFINIPQSQVIISNNSIITCYIGTKWNLKSNLQCKKFNTSSLIVSNLCYTSKGCQPQSQIIFSLDTTIIQNPNYITDPLTNEDSVSMFSFYNVNTSLYYIDQLQQNSFVQPYLKPQNLINISNILVSSNYTSQIVQLTLTASMLNDVFSENYIKILFSSPVFNYNPYYDVQATINQQQSNNIIIQSDQNQLLQYLVLQCQDSCQGQSQLQIQINNIQNPFYIQTNYQQNYYLMYIQELYQIQPDEIKSEGILDLQPKVLKNIQLTNLTNVQVIQKNGIVNQSNSIQIEFEFLHRPNINKNATISIQMLPGFQLSNKSLNCTNPFTGFVYSCIYQKQFNSILISDYFSNYSHPISSVSFQLNGLINPSSQINGDLTVIIQYGSNFYGFDNKQFYLNIQNSSPNCPQDCAICGSDGFCYQCVQPSVHPILMNGACTDSCPDGQFENNLICYQCPTECETCQTYDQCSTCPEGQSVFSDGQCLDGTQCPSGTSINSKNQCVTQNGCLQNCSTCGLDQDYCYIAKNPYVSFNGMIVNQCPVSYFIANDSCVACDPLCEECAFSKQECTSCTGGPFLQNYLDFSQNYCVTQCSEGSYQDGINKNMCFQCSPQCATCEGSSDNCTSCLYDKDTLQDLFYYQGQCLQKCPMGLYANYTSHSCDSEPFLFNNLPHLFLLSSTGLTATLVASSKILSASLDSSQDLFLIGLTNVEFLNRLFTLGNLWVSTKSFSFCVTGLNLLANSLLGIYFVTLVVSPLSSQITPSSSKSFLFKSIVTLSQITGVNSIRLLTSGFMGVKVLSNKYTQIPYYSTQLETLSIISGVFSLFQLATGISCLFDFSKQKDAFGFGMNAIILNTLLIGLKISKFHKSIQLFKAYTYIAPANSNRV